MKITICGSSAFRKDIIEYRDRLNEMGHEGIVHPVYEEIVAGRMQDIKEQIETEHAEAKKKYGFIKWYYDSIVASDAILVLNLEKRGVQNYIGGNTLMEIAFAHVHDKKVYLLNPAPEEVSYRDEILAMMDEVLHGDLSKIRSA